MAGTIIAKLNATQQANGTAITAANSGFTSVQIPSGTTFTHQSAAQMGESAGYRVSQAGSANQPFAYLDFSPQTVFAFRIPYRFSTTPAANAAVFRGYSTTDHVSVLWTMSHTTANRIQFVEASPGTLNVTSASGTPVVANTDYVMLGLLNMSTLSLTIRMFPRTSTTALFEMTGALTQSTGVTAIRFGVGTATSLTQLDTNDAFAVGSGDFLARTDVAAPPLAASLVLNPTSGTVPYTQTAVVSTTGGTGTALSYSMSWGDGTATVGPQASPNFSHTVTTAGSYTATATATNA